MHPQTLLKKPKTCKRLSEFILNPGNFTSRKYFNLKTATYICHNYFINFTQAKGKENIQFSLKVNCKYTSLKSATILTTEPENITNGQSLKFIIKNPSTIREVPGTHFIADLLNMKYFCLLLCVVKA